MWQTLRDIDPLVCTLERTFTMIVPQQRLRGGRSILELLAPAQHPPSLGPLLYSREPFDFARQPRPADLAGRLEAQAASVLGVTDHALLIVLGQFAQKLGLLSRLQQVPIAQRTVDHTPQAKLIQFFVGILILFAGANLAFQSLYFVGLLLFFLTLLLNFIGDRLVRRIREEY